MERKTEFLHDLNISSTRELVDNHQNILSYEMYNNLYLNITNKCSSDCEFCIKKAEDGVFKYNLWLNYEPSIEDVILHLSQFDLEIYKEIVFTGFGEPTMRFDVLIKVIAWLHAQGMKVRLDTNGHASLINPGLNVVSELKKAGLNSVSVSLNAQNEQLYNKYLKPMYHHSYSAMLKFAKECIKIGIETRLTIVDIPEIDIMACEKIAHDMGATFSVRHLL